VSETKSNINVYRLDLLGKTGLWVVVFLNLLGAALRAGPTYFEPAYIKATMVKVAEWQLQHQKARDMREASNGVFHTGIFAAYEATGNPEPHIIAPAKQFVDDYLKSPVNDTKNKLITFGLAYGVNAGLLPRSEFEAVVRKAWTGLSTACLQPDFRVGWSEGSTAQPIRTYRRDSHHLFSTGAFLLAGTEVAKRCPPPAVPVPGRRMSAAIL
jgi:rhamnogalacturonyl hydrolase YesR